ncbi:MAG: hypothetical protein D6701_11825 [Gemmatimonadetes bacterium]|nr:MAG: hypothetical protein D6701_11825 [Gemmatimonadota bacterium]
MAGRPRNSGHRPIPPGAGSFTPLLARGVFRIAHTTTRRLRRVALVALFAWACEPASAPEPVRIGLLANFTGPLAGASGIPARRGAALAVDEINDAGGVFVAGVARPVEIVEGDFEDRADAAAFRARELVNLDGVAALVGPFLSRHAIAVAAVADDAEVPMLSPMSSSHETTEGHAFAARLAFMDDFQGEALARFARERLGAQTAAILYDESSAYSRGLADRFRAGFEARGGRVVVDERFTADVADDFSSAMRRIARAAPDVLVLPQFSPVADRQMVQARVAGVRAVFLGGDSWDLRSLAAVPEAEGAYVTHQWHTDLPRPETRAFVERYQARYGELPRSTAPLTYDAVHLVAAAISRAGSLEGPRIMEALLETRDYHGATGTITFAGSPDPQRSAVVSRVVGGEVEMVAVLDPEPRPDGAP